MKYTYDEKIEMEIQAENWDKNSSKELLQYAVGGLLYMPATNVKIAQDIINKRFPDIKALALCLEDAIGDDVVRTAETCVKSVLTELYNAVKAGAISVDEIPLIFIRVREVGQMARLFKLCGRRAFSMLTGFNLPKFDDTNCVEYVNEFKGIITECKTKLYIMPILESKNIMYNQMRMKNLVFINDTLKIVNDNVLNIRVGATDFCNLFGMRRDMGSTIYDVKVVADCLADVINVFARNYVCSAPVWEYFGTEEGAWSEGLRRELRMDRLNGFIGKTCIHPSQLKHIQESFIVSYENYKDALNILGMSDGLVGVKKGHGDNKMNEVKAHSNWARKVIGMANVYGVRAE